MNCASAVEEVKSTLAVSYDAHTDVLTVEGMRFAGDLFRGMATFPVGTIIEFVARGDGVVTLRRISP